MEFDNMTGAGLSRKACPICASDSGLQRCTGCQVVSYCGPAHQSAHRSKHKADCRAIKTAREKLQSEESALRALPAGFGLPQDVFTTSVGNFWGILGTRDYMRARFAAADALLRINNVVAVEKALEHFRDMLRLGRSDNLGIRDIVPHLLLRLGRDQECYDFIKWWATVGGGYDLGDVVASPYLNIRNADVFEPVDKFCSEYDPSLSHLVALTLLKLRLHLDIDALETASIDAMGNWFFSSHDIELHRPVSNLAKNKWKSGTYPSVAQLEGQYKKSLQAVQAANPHFWERLVESEGSDAPAPPPYYSAGSPEEATLVLSQCKHAWEETQDAILIISSDTSSFVTVYESPAAGTPKKSGILRNQKGTGVLSPKLFKPRLQSSSPADMFQPTPTKNSPVARFICIDDKQKVLVYVDGACANNGQRNPRAGWAVVHAPGPAHGAVSGRLENKGPFGDVSVPTSNRAELRATIAALRLSNWREEGFGTIVIATDSTYVIDGATAWTKAWFRNGWKTRTGDPVKNKDLWDLLLGDIEQWKDRGLEVEFWRVPRELNSDADAAAKRATSQDMDDVESFTDFAMDFTQGLTPAVRPPGSTQVLALCLEQEDIFMDIWGSLMSQIGSKAQIERAANQDRALAMLDRATSAPVILVADAGIARDTEVYERVVDRLREGATVILGGLFSSMVTSGEFDRVFARIGLPWKRASYYRTTTQLSRDAVGSRLASCLPSEYSQKAVYVENVEKSAVWYYPEETKREAAVVFAKVGQGKLGYVGDVNGEAGSTAVVMAMCGLVN